MTRVDSACCCFCIGVFRQSFSGRERPEPTGFGGEEEERERERGVELVEAEVGWHM